MKQLAIFNYASRLREIGNTFILAELEKAGLRDIAPSHGDVLGQLLTCDSRNMSELAFHAHRTKSTVTALVTKLEKNGYVERIPDPEDSRGVKVRLTEKGRALKPAFDAISEGLQAIITDRLSEEEALKLEQLLAACVEKHADGKC
ncbi:MarR family winged helix-turn-helix transcriptional regulator [Mailhella massiliensis]|uniref:MarR family winged helix-turn-helix transcriptional regulator n=1 Tax=Mailhella massiliensis TaxID=1903261 RepID=UPI0023524678|nr:MarR family transcriptional regulator [Mailhella massiliensis]